MISPISIATRGRITQSIKRTLTIATIGWLVIGGIPPTPSKGTTGEGAGIVRQQVEKEDRTWYYEEEEVLNIIKIWTKCNG